MHTNSITINESKILVSQTPFFREIDEFEACIRVFLFFIFPKTCITVDYVILCPRFCHPSRSLSLDSYRL